MMRLNDILVGPVARLPARLQTKLLIAFLAIVAALITLGVLGLAPSTCQVGLAGCRRLAVGMEVYCQPVLQISAQTWNVWALEALCSAAVT